LGLTPWCTQYIYPYFDEVFLALKDNKTDSIACCRINLCQSKIISITGDIMFAVNDILSVIMPLPNNQIDRRDLDKIVHPQVPVAVISGFSCGPDYCAVLLQGKDVSGNPRYGTTALSIASNGQVKQTPQILAAVGSWYGPWYDAHTDEFWLAYGSPANFTFGLFDPSAGIFRPRINTRLRIPQQDVPILSGAVLNRVLYFTVKGDLHVFVLDLALHLFTGNLTMPAPNIMLAVNPLTQLLYGYTAGAEGVFRFDSPTSHTKIAGPLPTGFALVPSATIDPTENTLWISLWGSVNRAFLKIDLTKTSNNTLAAPTKDLEGFFDFNPYQIQRVDV